MWRVLRFVVLPAGLLVGGGAAAAAAGGWLRDVEHALDLAQAQQRPLVVFVSMDGCGHCVRMVRTTFRDNDVRQALGESFVAAAVKASERPDLVKHLQIRSFPTTLLVGSDGQVLDQLVGYVDARTFRQRLQAVAGLVRQRQAARAQTDPRYAARTPDPAAR
jgi:thioredoxin-related protein